MMIVLVVVSAFCVFLASMFTHRLRSLWVALAGIIFIGSTAIVTLNYSHHFGMKQVTTSSSSVIYSATSKQGMPVILYQPVGTSGRDDVYLYNESPDQKKPSHTAANEQTRNYLQYTNGDQVRLTTKETRWQYRSSWDHFLFAGSGMDGKLVKRTNTFYYPRYYVKATPKQIKRLAAQMAKQKATTAAVPAVSASASNQSTMMKAKAQMLKQALANK